MYKTEEDSNSSATAAPKQQKPPSEYMKVQRMFRQQTKNEYGKSIPKNKRLPIDYSTVLDYRNIEANTQLNKERIIDCTHCLVDHSTVSDSPYYAHPSTWQVYGLKDYPGFYFIPSVFSVKQQRKWIKDALEHYAEPPNNTNLNIFYGQVKSLWSNAQSEFIELHQQLEKQLTLDDNEQEAAEEKEQKKRPLDKNGEELPTYRTLLDKLAWATLGYQFQWTPRIYSEEFYEAFPQDLKELVTHIAKATRYDPYMPEAATINFYSEDSVMGGHLDDAEEEMEKPIISISFGSTAVFLMGAETRDVPPIPIFIRSGDIMIMGGRSRYCYHGVARIVEDSFDAELLDDSKEDDDCRWHVHWMKEKNRRININTRQVFKVPKQGGVNSQDNK